MPLEFPCPTCQMALRLPDGARSTNQVRCPRCGEIITVPAEPVAKVAEFATPKPEPEPEPELVVPEPPPVAVTTRSKPSQAPG